MILIGVFHKDNLISHQSFSKWQDAMNYCTSLNPIYTTKLLANN